MTHEHEEIRGTVRLQLLKAVLVRNRVFPCVAAFAMLIAVCALVIMLVEPGIASYGEALWYCFAVVSTAGFGDITVTHLVSRVLSVVLWVGSVLVVALVTSVAVTFYSEMSKAQRETSLSLFMDKLEHLPDLSPDELRTMSENIKRLRR